MRRALLLVLLLAACTKHEPGDTGSLQLALTGPADAQPFATADAVDVIIVDPGRSAPWVQPVPWPPGDATPIEFLLEPNGLEWSLVVAARAGGAIIALGRSGPFDLVAGQSVTVPVFVGMVNEFGTSAASLAQARAGHTALALPDGRLVVVGGAAEGDPLEPVSLASSLELLDPLGRDPAAALPGFRDVEGMASRTLHGALLADGKVVVTGGLDAGGAPLGDLWVLAPGESRPNVQLPSGMAARAGAAVALIGPWTGAAPESDSGKLLVAGGCASAKPLTGCTPDAWVVGLDGSGHAVPGFDVVRFGATATPLPGHGDVLVAGGRDLSGLASAVYLLESHTLDRATGEMRPVAAILTPRERHAAVTLPDGAVLLVGGLDTDGTPLASAEVYVPWLGTAGRMLPAGGMTQARFDAAAVALADGSIVVVGGVGADGTTPLDTVERFVPDPAGPDATTYRGAFAQLSATLPTARSSAAAALGPGGELLVSGGLGRRPARLHAVPARRGAELPHAVAGSHVA
jgi:hypothetical protein